MRYHCYTFSLTDYTLSILGDGHKLAAVDLFRCTSMADVFDAMVDVAAVKEIPSGAQAAFGRAVNSLLQAVPRVDVEDVQRFVPRVEKWNEQVAEKFSREASRYEQ